MTSDDIPEWVGTRLSNMGWSVLTEWSAANELGHTYLLQHKSGANVRVQGKCCAAFLHGLEMGLNLRDKS